MREHPSLNDVWFYFGQSSRKLKWHIDSGLLAETKLASIFDHFLSAPLRAPTRWKNGLSERASALVKSVLNPSPAVSKSGAAFSESPATPVTSLIVEQGLKPRRSAHS